MGPTDRIEHPTPITLGASFSESLTVHLPPLQSPGLEELLEDQLEDPLERGTSFPGPVDVVMIPDEARRYFEN